MTRYIHQIFTPDTGQLVSNEELKAFYFEVLDRSTFDHATRDQLRESVNYFLMGARSRKSVADWRSLKTFADRATQFEAAADNAVVQVADQVREAVGPHVEFDAILTTTSTGSLMPSISYRLAKQLPDHVRTDTMMVDLGHVGCTGGVKLLNLVTQLGPAMRHCLLVSLEFPTTLINTETALVDVWQGNCTFGDGGARAVDFRRASRRGRSGDRRGRVSATRQRGTGPDTLGLFRLLQLSARRRKDVQSRCA